jgi:signal peptidase I
LHATLFQAMVIPTAGMAPSLEPGDRFLVDHTLAPRRWDIITFRTPEGGDIWGQRLVGLPGETVEIKDGKVHINGAPFDPPAGVPIIHYQSHPPYPAAHRGPLNGCEGNPITLGPGECFVLGDNTAASLDSRYFTTPARPGMQPGALPKEDIRGVVRCIFAPAPRLKVFR